MKTSRVKGKGSFRPRLGDSSSKKPSLERDENKFYHLSLVDGWKTYEKYKESQIRRLSLEGLDKIQRYVHSEGTGDSTRTSWFNSLAGTP